MSTETAAPRLSRPPAKSRTIFSSLGTPEGVPAGTQLAAREAVADLYRIGAGMVEVKREGGCSIQLGPGELAGEAAFLDNAPRRHDMAVASAARVG